MWKLCPNRRACWCWIVTFTRFWCSFIVEQIIWIKICGPCVWLNDNRSTYCSQKTIQKNNWTIMLWKNSNIIESSSWLPQGVPSERDAIMDRFRVEQMDKKYSWSSCENSVSFVHVARELPPKYINSIRRHVSIFSENVLKTTKKLHTQKALKFRVMWIRPSNRFWTLLQS